MSPPAVPGAIEFEPDLGLVRLTRAHLQLLTATHGTTDGPELAELRAIGAIGEDGPHPGLVPCLAVLRQASSRFFLRTWRRGERRVVEGVVGPDGIVVLPGGTAPDAIQDLRFHPRPTALARVLAGLVGLGPATGSPPVPDRPLAWEEVRGLASPDGAVTVHDLSWQAEPGGPRGSVLVLVVDARTGPAEVVAADVDDPGAGYRLLPRSPEEIWLGLCRLTAG